MADPRKPLLWLHNCSLVKWLSALALSWLLQPGIWGLGRGEKEKEKERERNKEREREEAGEKHVKKDGGGMRGEREKGVRESEREKAERIKAIFFFSFIKLTLETLY